MPESSFPKISIVTPSFNQGAFLGEAMDSVLGQNYPDLEYVVMDGGSTDGSVEIIRRHEARLASWTSAPDDGHYAALNTGFGRTTGEIMGWLNSDDKFLPWSFSVVAEIFARFPAIEWLTTLFPMRWDAKGRAVRCVKRSGYSQGAFAAGENLPAGRWHYEGWIQQESTFWRRSLWERAGGMLNPRWSLAADFDLWARFHRHARLYAVDTPLGGFRLHGDQKTGHQKKLYLSQSRQILEESGGRIPGRVESLMRSVARRSPEVLHPFCASLGLLRSTRLCLRNRANDGWDIVSGVH